MTALGTRRFSPKLSILHQADVLPAALQLEGSRRDALIPWGFLGSSITSQLVSWTYEALLLRSSWCEVACEGLTAFKGHPKRSKEKSTCVFVCRTWKFPSDGQESASNRPISAPRGGLAGAQGHAGVGGNE